MKLILHLTVLGSVLGATTAMGADQASASQANEERGRDPGALPEKARVTYQGEYSVTVTNPSRTTRGPLGIKIPQSKKLNAMVTYNLIFDGASITGTYKSTASTASADPVTGTYRNGICKLFSTEAVTEGACDALGFSGRIRASGTGNSQVNGTFTTDAVKVVDVMAEASAEHRRQEANKRQRESETAAEAARIASLPAATRQQASLLAAAITQDSSSWISNRYEQNSLTNVRISGTNPGQTTVRGEYRFNQNDTGWVEGRIVNGRVECLQYWDTPSCSHVRVRLAAEARPQSDQSSSTQPNGTPSQVLRWALVEDSQSWSFDKLAANSQGPAIEQSGDTAPGKVFRMNFKYTNNAPGWIEGRFQEGQLSSIRYQNFPHWSDVRTDDWRRREAVRNMNEDAKDRLRGRILQESWCASGADPNCR